MKRYSCPKCDFWIDGEDASLAAYCLYCRTPMLVEKNPATTEEKNKGSLRD